MTTILRSCALIALASGLVACGSDKSGTSASSGSNEVVKGTISDDMIAYDTLRSQPPAAKIIATGTSAPDSSPNRRNASADATEAAQPAETAEGEPASQREQSTAPKPATEAE